MLKPKRQFKTIDQYIDTFPKEVQELLQIFRQTVKKAAPAEAAEKISYQIPTFTFHGNLVYFAAFKNHIGFYPTSGAVEAFKKELSFYKTAKGTIQFPLDKSLPLTLISKIVRYRVRENLARKQKK